MLSARYAGEPSNPKKNIEKVLAALDGVVERKARFVSIVVLVGAGGKFSAEGELTGTIAKSRSGDGGFGYDSVFIPAHFEKTLAALKSEKSPIKTHRERALAALLEKVRESSLK